MVWPRVAAAAAVLAAGAAVLTLGGPPKSASLPIGALTFGIVTSGFVATQRNMFLSMSGARVIRFAVRTGYHEGVLSYLRSCIRGGLLVTLASLIGLLLSGGAWAWAWNAWVVLTVGLVTLTVCLVARSEMLMERISSRFLEEQGHQTPADDDVEED